MSFLEIGGERKAVPIGESAIGSDPSAQIRLDGAGVAARHAVLEAGGDGQVVIRRASDEADIQINGVRLGPQPTPLLHGDKIGIAGQELLFVDERRSGSTQYVQAVNPASLAAAAGKVGAKHAPTAATGGRVVSLTDGREYTIVGTSLVFGRDAGCDVVVTSKEASRRHAEIMATPKGYVLVDSSTNGTWVNGQRVQGQRLLARADVIRLGDNEFRFYADKAPVAPASPPPAAERRLSNTLLGVPGQQRKPAAAAPAPASPPAAPASPRTGEDVVVPPSRPAAAGASVPGAPPPAAPPAAPPKAPAPAPAAAQRAAGAPLAYLVIRSGSLKGQRVGIKVPVVNVGRADYNDIPLPDDSVSTVHAKIQRREGIWMLVDLDSTNGSFVDGERVEGDVALAPGALVRFGEVRAFFEPADTDEGPAQGGSTRLLQAIKLPGKP